MTNLQKTQKIWEDTMGEKMPYDFEKYLNQYKKSYQTVDALCNLTKEKLAGTIRDSLWGSYDPKYPNETIYERADRYAAQNMEKLNQFKSRLNK